MGFRYLLKENLGKIPKAAGVYALCTKDKILYIGKAANLRDRVKNHFLQPSYRDHLFLEQSSKIGYLETQSEIDALLLESHLIKKHQPKYNVMWKDDKRYFYVAIAKKPLPYLFLTHQPKNDTRGELSSPRSSPRFIGPFVDGKSIKETLSLLRRIFPYYTSSRHPLKKCSWCHLELCPGPNPNTKEYKQNLKNLIAVLEGKRLSVLRTIEKEMHAASKNKEYECAAKLRDQLFTLKNIVSHSNNVQKTLQTIFQVKKEIRRIEAYDISNMQGKEATGSLVIFVDEKPAKNWYRKFKIHIAGKPNDFAMLQETISRRFRHPEWPYPDLMIIDGGKPQLSAALKALQEFQKPNFKFQIKSKIQIAALAKRNNELFLPNRKEPILLKTLPQSVQNLILHIRDEAHRFAITYHKHLRRVDFLKVE